MTPVITFYRAASVFVPGIVCRVTRPNGYSQWTWYRGYSASAHIQPGGLYSWIMTYPGGVAQGELMDTRQVPLHFERWLEAQ